MSTQITREHAQTWFSSHKQDVALMESVALGILNIPPGAEGPDPQTPNTDWREGYYFDCMMHCVIGCVIAPDPLNPELVSIEIRTKYSDRFLREGGVPYILAEAERLGADWSISEDGSEIRLGGIERIGAEAVALRLLRLVQVHSDVKEGDDEEGSESFESSVNNDDD